MIVVEGLDNTGKTTLVNRILDEFPELEYRESIGNKHDLEVIQDQAHDEAFFWNKLKYTVGDRSRLISEFIYNPILKGRQYAFPFHSWLEMMGSFVQGLNLVVVCYRSRLQIVSSFDEREQLKGVRQHLTEIDDQYSRLPTLLRFINVAGEGQTYAMAWSFEKDPDVVVFNAVRRYLDQVKEVG